jgi:hypothetical protein
MKKTRASVQQMTKGLAGDQERSLSDELTQLNDDFVEFSEINAFLCHAFASALSDHEWLNSDAIDGSRHCHIPIPERVKGRLSTRACAIPPSMRKNEIPDRRIFE